MASLCLTENEVQALLEGALGGSRIAVVEPHLDACVGCQLLLSAGVRTMSLRTHGLKIDPAAVIRFETGELIASRYEIKRFLARGGMGEVYAAHDTMLGEEIALKILFRPSETDADAFSRLKAEVQLARRVTSPHVSRVFDLGQTNLSDGTEILFLTMQLLQGETLRERLRREGPLPQSEVWRLATDMFAALGAAHQMGIVHRDFKSDNVMLVAMNSPGHVRAVVMDFGLAQATAGDARSAPGEKPLIVGTLGYMAPEQLAGGSVTAAADVYAFGVVLHEMLTGVLPPFRPNAGQEGEQPPPPSHLLDHLHLPPKWDALIRRCLSREPSGRFPNMLAAHDVIARSPRPYRRVAFATAAGIALALNLGVMFWRRASAVMVPPATAIARPEVKAAAPVPVLVSTSPTPRSAASRPSIRRRARSRLDGSPRPGGVPSLPSATVDVATSSESTPTVAAPQLRPDDAIDPFREAR